MLKDNELFFSQEDEKAFEARVETTIEEQIMPDFHQNIVEALAKSGEALKANPTLSGLNSAIDKGELEIKDGSSLHSYYTALQSNPDLIKQYKEIDKIKAERETYRQDYDKEIASKAYEELNKQGIQTDSITAREEVENFFSSINKNLQEFSPQVKKWLEDNFDLDKNVPKDFNEEYFNMFRRVQEGIKAMHLANFEGYNQENADKYKELEDMLLKIKMY